MAKRLAVLVTELRELLRRRGEASRTLEAAEASERAALSELATIEGTLKRLVATRNDATARLAEAGADVATQEAALAAALAEDDGSGADQVRQGLAATRRRQASSMDLLGQTNTEIAHWQGLADRAARRIGEARSRALDASQVLKGLQETGPSRADEARERLSGLGGDGERDRDGLGGAWREDLDALLEEHPALWPAEAPPIYAPPRGAIVPVLVAGAPLAAEVARPAIGAREFQAELGDGGAWVRPITGPITTSYGSSTPYFPTHWAVDVGAKLYAPVAAAAAGRVEYVGLATTGEPRANQGMVVVVRHGARLLSVYAHLDAAAFAPPVKGGDMVGPGDVIGRTGMTGYSTGPHLHFETRLDNRPFDPGLLMALGV